MLHRQYAIVTACLQAHGSKAFADTQVCFVWKIHSDWALQQNYNKATRYLGFELIDI
jgi:hypothetical protein